jgi:hypothetical protein
MGCRSNAHYANLRSSALTPRELWLASQRLPAEALAKAGDQRTGNRSGTVLNPPTVCGLAVRS